MSDVDEKDSGLVKQENAVENYLSSLLDDSFDDQSSSERAADNIAGLFSDTANPVENEDLKQKDIVDREQSMDAAEIQDVRQEELQENLQHGIQETPEEAISNPDCGVVADEAPRMQKGVEIDEEQQDFPNRLMEFSADSVDESEPLVVDYQDSRDDPQVIAEAEKMLSYVFSQPVAAENTPLRKLQDAGVVKISEPSQKVSPSLEKKVPNKAVINSPLELVPSYAADRFTMMKFRVNGLNMLVSVTELRNVKRVDSELSTVAGKPNWLYQCQKPEGGTGFVVDGSQLFVTDNGSATSTDDFSDKYIVS